MNSNTIKTATFSTVLIGNSFPMSLIRRKVTITPVSLDELRQAAGGRRIASFWGHANTLAAANAWSGLDLKPATDRPALELSSRQLPTLDGEEFSECFVLAPDYRSGFRPAIGQEVSSEEISGWQVLHFQWG